MRTTLPTKWAVKGENKYQYKVIADYANPLNIEYNGDKWGVNDSKLYILHIKNGKYRGGSPELDLDFELITFEEFERLVLDKSTEPTYEIF